MLSSLTVWHNLIYWKSSNKVGCVLLCGGARQTMRPVQGPVRLILLALLSFYFYDTFSVYLVMQDCKTRIRTRNKIKSVLRRKYSIEHSVVP